MKIKYYIKLLLPLCCFGVIFRALEIMFAIEPESGFFYLESVIPLLFNIYLLLVCAFYLTLIFFTKPEAKTIRSRLTKTTRFDSFVILAAAVFMLSSSMKNLITKWLVNDEYASAADIFKDFPVYIFLTGIIGALFLVIFASSPKKVTKSKAIAAFSLALPIYYVIRLFSQFTDMSQILSHSYGTYTIIMLGMLALTTINLSKILAGTICRKFFISFGLIAVFMTAVHFVELVLAFVPGNPYNIEIDLLSYLADIFIALFILKLIIKLTKKSKKEASLIDSPDLPEAEETQELEAIKVEADQQ